MEEKSLQNAENAKEREAREDERKAKEKWKLEEKEDRNAKTKRMAEMKEERAARATLAKELVRVAPRKCFRTLRNDKQYRAKRKGGSIRVAEATLVEVFAKGIGGLVSSVPFETHRSPPFTADVGAQNYPMPKYQPDSTDDTGKSIWWETNGPNSNKIIPTYISFPRQSKECAFCSDWHIFEMF